MHTKRGTSRITFGLCLALGLVAPLTAAHAADVKLLSSTAMAEVMADLTPQFEKATGHKIVAVYEPTTGILARIKGGEASDVIIVLKQNVDDLKAAGKIAADSTANIAKTALALCVRSGAAKPDISTPEAFKAAMLSAKSIARSESGASGTHVGKVLEQLGIADAMKAKTTLTKGAARTADLAAKGEVEIAMQMMSEMQVPGVDIVGPLPGNLHYEIVLAAGVSADAKETAAAKALIAFLTAPAAGPALKKAGMQGM
jgi:molybdate transport system substrate-binding protein